MAFTCLAILRTEKQLWGGAGVGVGLFKARMQHEPARDGGEGRLLALKEAASSSTVVSNLRHRQHQRKQQLYLASKRSKNLSHTGGSCGCSRSCQCFPSPTRDGGDMDDDLSA